MTTNIAKREPLLPNAIFATMIFVGTEIMFFMGLISAFMVIKASANTDEFIVPASVRLPVYTTGFNTLVLFLSGFFLFRSLQLLSRGSDRAKVETNFLIAIILGLFFVGYQGYEWLNLMKWGMTLHTNLFTGLFYLIIGSHGIHALCAILVMAILYARLRSQKLTKVQLQAMVIFWLFVVGIWPVLYGLVYF